jgi:1,4-dihydroxy-2-naphthoate octaprenyltransferase
MWVAGARPRTLPAAIVPVLVGTAVAAGVTAVFDQGGWFMVAPNAGIIFSGGSAGPLKGLFLGRMLAAMVVALAIQVGTNYANDYSDGIRGTDSEGRVGPLPYGYRALGEVFVFVFFGPVAVVGTTYVQTLTLPGLAWAVSVPVGLLIVAILVVNNLRDIEGDAAVGKRTLAVLVGDRRTRLLFVGLFVVAFAVIAAVGVVRPPALLGLLAAPLAVPPGRTVLSGGRGPALIGALQGTGLLTLATGVLLGAGLALSG